MLPWDLEDWLTEEGDRVVRKRAARGDGALSDKERLLYEVWLFDTEVRNGGVSQYFGNNGSAQWATYVSAAQSKLPSFRTLAIAINQVLACQQDPYEAVIESGDVLEKAYGAVQSGLIGELKSYLQQK